MQREMQQRLQDLRRRLQLVADRQLVEALQEEERQHRERLEQQARRLQEARAEEERREQEQALAAAEALRLGRQELRDAVLRLNQVGVVGAVGHAGPRPRPQRRALGAPAARAAPHAG